MSDASLTAQCFEQRSLLRSARVSLLSVAALLLLITLFGAYRLQLGGTYPVKVLAIFCVGALLILRGLPSYHPFPAMGAANQVTLMRGALVTLLAGLIGERAPFAAMVAAALALAVIIMDGLDGWLARRTRMASPFGARFDMETDAVLVAVLAVLAWQFGKVGVWVLLSGAMRYLFALAAMAMPLLRRPVPSSKRGKTIAVIQMLALIIAIAPLSSLQAAAAIAAIALGLLIASFLLDVVWLRQWARSA
jgi:phosphatidylglycerophosphate synthase